MLKEFYIYRIINIVTFILSKKNFQRIFIFSLLWRSFFLVDWDSSKDERISFGNHFFYCKLSDRIIASIGEISLSIFLSNKFKIKYILIINIFLAEIFAWLALILNATYFCGNYEYKFWGLSFFIIALKNAKEKNVIYTLVYFLITIYYLKYKEICSEKTKINYSVSAIKNNIKKSIKTNNVDKDWKKWKSNKSWMNIIFGLSSILTFF